MDVFFVLPRLLLLMLCGLIPLITVDVDGGGGEGTRNFPSKLAVGDIVHVATGEKVSFSQLMDFIEEARIVYVGEVHTNVESHEVQLQLLREFYDKYGDNVAIGMEMFKRPYQAVLDRWSRGEITEEELLEGSRWEQEWGYDYDLYNDILDFARQKGIPIIALNVSKELQKKVSRKGLDGLSYSDRRKLPAIDTSDKYHRRYLRKILQNPGAGPVHVGVIIKQDVHIGVTKERIPTDDFGEGNGEHLGRERVCDLLLDHLGRLPRIGCEDNHLHIRKIGYGIERDVERGPETAGDNSRGHDDDQHLVANACGDDPLDHSDRPSLFARSRNFAIASWILLSESSMNWACVTTSSPEATPFTI